MTRSVCEFASQAKFLARLCGLSGPNRMAARRAYALFAKNPDHPSLRFKKLGGYDDVWSVRVNEQYRAVGERKGDTIIWV